MEVDSLGTPYDYASVMHYGRTAFGDGKVTIRTKDCRYGDVIGKRVGLSKIDIRQVNLMYNCQQKLQELDEVDEGEEEDPIPDVSLSKKVLDIDRHCFSIAKIGCTKSFN